MDSNNLKKCSKFLIIRKMQINIETLLPASENSYHEHICQKMLKKM